MAQTLLWQLIQGAQGLYTDWNSDNDGIRNKVGQSLEQILGAASALPSSNASGLLPLACVPGSGLQVVVGGTNQGVYLQDRVCDSCPAQSLTVPANATGSTRYDLVAIQYQQVQVNGTSRQNKNPGTGVVTNQTVYQLEDSFLAEYVVGTTSLPATPTGWVAFAQVAVPNGASSISAGEITILLSSVASLLAGILTPFFSGSGIHGVTTTSGGFVIQAPTGSGGGPMTIAVNDTSNNGFPSPMRALINDGTNKIIVNITAGGSSPLTATTEQILAGTIGATMASGALVTFAGVTEHLPIGSVGKVYQRLSAQPSTTVLTVTLPTQGVWNLYASAEGFLNGNSTMSIAISGATSSESGVGTNSIKMPAQGGFGKADCNGSSQGGQTITVTVTFSQASWLQNGSSVPMAGTMQLIATRVG